MLTQRTWSARMAGLVILSIMLANAVSALGQSRISSQINDQDRVVVRGTTSHLLAKSADQGRMAPDQKLGRMVLVLTPTAEQELQEEAFIQALHDPTSPSFHMWLSPQEYGERFGVTPQDAATVQGWLQAQGLTVHEIAQGRRFVTFSGTVAQVEKAFATEMHNYTFKNKKFVSNAKDMQIPAALQPVVKGVVRLHSDPRMTNVVMGPKVHFNKTTKQFETGGGHYLGPADFAKIYNVQPLYDAGIDGTGQAIAIVGRSNINVQDVSDFRTQFGLQANDPQVIINGDDPDLVNGDYEEAMLDVTWSGAVAPKATIKFVVSQSNFGDGVDASAAYIVDHNLAPVMSTSFGLCEQNLGPVQNAFYNSLWKQAATQGITSFVSSGDNGGAGCDPTAGTYATGVAVNGIASTPYNVAVGGTQFDDTANPSFYWNSISDPVTLASALGYIPEKVWNESDNDPLNVYLWSGGGGVSTIYAKPAWQSAPGVPSDGKRDVPDISLTAALHDGYLVCLFGSCGNGQYFYSFGGTSASSPVAAGIMALVNQKMGGQPQGLANYVLYRLASVPGVYHDITVGDNKVPDSKGQYTAGYSAAPGYDRASGLGSFDANALVNNWQAASIGTDSKTTLALAAKQVFPVVHGTPITFKSTVKCASGKKCNAATGSVSLLATNVGGSESGAGTGQLVSGTPSHVHISTAALPGGTYNVTARYGGDGTYNASSSTAVPVTVDPEPSQTIVGVMGGGAFLTTPLTVSYGEPPQVGIVVAGKSGIGYPSGQMTLLQDGQPTVTLGAYGLKPSPLVLNYGEKSTLVQGGSVPTSQSSTVAFLCLQGLEQCPQASALNVGTHQLQASYPGDNSFAASQGTYGFNVKKADSAIVDFFPDGSPVVGVPVTLKGQIVLTNNWCSPYGGTVTVTDVTGSPVVIGSAPASQQYCDSYNVDVTFRTPGTHILKLGFSGDSNVNGSTSGNYYLPVTTNAASNTSLNADLTNAMVGTPITLTATVVTPVAHDQPAGQRVMFKDGNTILGTAPLGNPVNLGGGSYGLTAQLVVSNLAGGQHSLTASYGGDAVLTASDSSGVPVLVTVTDYTPLVAPTALTIKTGSSGVATLTVFPLGGFAQTVQFSCGRLPTNATCTFSKPSLALDGTNPASVQVTITVTRTSGQPQSFSVNMSTTSPGSAAKPLTILVNVTK